MVRFIAMYPLADLTIVVQKAESTREKYARAPKITPNELQPILL